MSRTAYSILERFRVFSGFPGRRNFAGKQVALTCSSFRYPAQEHVGGDSKIPSILYYDRQGAVRAVGAETLQQQIIDQAEEENWDKVEW